MFGSKRAPRTCCAGTTLPEQLRACAQGLFTSCGCGSQRSKPPPVPPLVRPQNEADAYRNVKLRVEDVQGRNCLTQFHGMDLTTDKLRSLVRKWQTLIEAHVDVKTTDGYFLRLFCIAFTKKRPGQVKKTAYAQSSQVRAVTGGVGGLRRQLPARVLRARLAARWWSPTANLCMPCVPTRFLAPS